MTILTGLWILEMTIIPIRKWWGMGRCVEVIFCHGGMLMCSLWVCSVCLYTLNWTSSVLMIRQNCSNTGIICTCRCSKIWGFQCCSLLLMGTILVFLLMAKLGPAKPIQWWELKWVLNKWEPEWFLLVYSCTYIYHSVCTATVYSRMCTLYTGFSLGLHDIKVEPPRKLSLEGLDAAWASNEFWQVDVWTN